MNCHKNESERKDNGAYPNKKEMHEYKKEVKLLGCDKIESYISPKKNVYSLSLNERKDT